MRTYSASRLRSAAPAARFERRLYDLLRSLGIARSGGGGPAGWRRAAWSPYRFRCEAGSGSADRNAAREPLVVGAVKAFVEDHAGEAIDLERLAREANLSKYHFARTFREAEGVTPWAYVQRVRVRRARTLLDAGLPLAEVALRAGFYDQSHLTNTFKRIEGVTPGQYRRKKRKDLQERRRGGR